MNSLVSTIDSRGQIVLLSASVVEQDWTVNLCLERQEARYVLFQIRQEAMMIHDNHNNDFIESYQEVISYVLHSMQD
jgi:hypothetical protein